MKIIKTYWGNCTIINYNKNKYNDYFYYFSYFYESKEKIINNCLYFIIDSPNSFPKFKSKHSNIKIYYVCG